MILLLIGPTADILLCLCWPNTFYDFITDKTDWLISYYAYAGLTRFMILLLIGPTADILVCLC